MSSSVPPAATTAACRFWHTWWVWALMSPTPVTPPAALRAVIPEMNSNRPAASATVACAKCPLGTARRGDTTSCLGIGIPFRCASAGVVGAAVPVGLGRVVRAVVDLEKYRLLL